MVTRSRLALLSAAVVLAVAFFLWPSPPSAPAAGPRLHFHDGQRWTYELDWSAKTSGQVEPQFLKQVRALVAPH